MVKPLILSVAVLSMACSPLAMAQSQPSVIIDRGGLLIRDLIEEPEDREQKERLLSDQMHQAEEAAQMLAEGLYAESLYPIISNTLRVGPVGADEGVGLQNNLLTLPMFIIGYDRVSVKWLKDNIDVLEQKRAIGLVVNVQTSNQMRELVNLTEGRVVLQPTPGDDLADALNLRHYPAFIDNQGLMR